MSLGKDLESIRKGLGLSLEEVQSAIKIPVHTLKSIENNSIFDGQEHNETYIRSFVRSYAKALKIKDEDIVAALDSYQSGTYDSSILLHDDPGETQDIEIEPEEPFDLSQVQPPDIKEVPRNPKPDVENVNWADLGKKFTLQETSPRTWIFGILTVVILVLIIMGIYFRQEIAGQFGSSEVSDNSTVPSPVIPDLQDEAIPDNAQGNTTGDSTIAEALAPQPGSAYTQTNTLSALSDTLSITVYAAFDKLEPVRVTSDYNWRTNPFWMEQGEAYTFDFQDTVLVRGQYSRMLILFNGHVVENPNQRYFSEDFNSIMLTRAIFEDSDYLQAASSEFPYEVGPPDSLVQPINY